MIIETTKDIIIPAARIINSVPVKEKPYLKSLSAEAPNITGTARQKLNSAAAVRERPSNIAPSMVEPEREVPGIIERTWKRPIKNAVEYGKEEIVCIL